MRNLGIQESMDLNSLVAIVSANTLVLAILAFLIKSIISHWLNKDVAKFKSDIEHTAKESFAIVQSDLEKERIRLQVSYSGIFEKQAEAIIELFKLLTTFESHINHALYDKDDKEEDYKKFVESWRELFNYFRINRILLPKNLDQLIDQFQSDIFFGVDQYRRLEKRLERDYIKEEQMDKIFSQQDVVLMELDKIQKLKEQLTHQLRLIIGISE